MQEISVELFDFRSGIHRHRLVNVTLLPASFALPEESQLAIRIPASAADPASLIIRATRDLVTIRELRFGLLLQRLDGLQKFVRDTLVGVETEDPLVLRLFDCELLLRAKPGPRVRDYARAAGFGKLARGVCRV